MTQNFHKSHGKEEFVKKLSMVAVLANFKLTEDIANLFTDAVESYGFDKATKALVELAIDVKPNRGFISVKDIIDKINPSIGLNESQKASDLASTIIGAVTRYGYNNSEKARQVIGEVGWHVVQRRGGWENFCEFLTLDNMRTTEAQIREELKSVIFQFDKGLLKLDDKKPDIQLKGQQEKVKAALHLVDRKVIKME
jgi:hypothetical protein